MRVGIAYIISLQARPATMLYVKMVKGRHGVHGVGDAPAQEPQPHHVDAKADPRHVRPSPPHHVQDTRRRPGYGGTGRRVTPAGSVTGRDGGTAAKASGNPRRFGASRRVILPRPCAKYMLPGRLTNYATRRVGGPCKFGRSSKPPDRDRRFAEQGRLLGEQPSGNTRVCSRTRLPGDAWGVPRTRIRIQNNAIIAAGEGAACRHARR